MKASEIVTKIKDVLLSSSEKEEETIPEVDLKEEAPKAKKEEAKQETKEEAPTAEVKQVSYSAEEGAEELQEDNYEEDIVEDAPAVEYATKDEVSELKSMVEKLRGMIEAKEEVPQELSADEPAEAINHSPENEVSEKIGTRFAPNANRNTTYNRVLNAITNN